MTYVKSDGGGKATPVWSLFQNSQHIACEIISEVRTGLKVVMYQNGAVLSRTPVLRRVMLGDPAPAGGSQVVRMVTPGGEKADQSDQPHQNAGAHPQHDTMVYGLPPNGVLSLPKTRSRHLCALAITGSVAR